jgi:ABC-type multidrug transport system ATPase subunit
VNGAAPSLATRGQLGFCQQSDEHFALTTVREAVEFAAYMRLPPSVDAETRRAFVDSLLKDLELDALADRLVGDTTGDVPGLAPGERKRLTFAVELAANPPILFLDEPTTGLDSRSALVVMRVVRKVASRGRAVICTSQLQSRTTIFLRPRPIWFGRLTCAIYRACAFLFCV